MLGSTRFVGRETKRDPVAGYLPAGTDQIRNVIADPPITQDVPSAVIMMIFNKTGAAAATANLPMLFNAPEINAAKLMNKI
jgi:hypothetical protein